MKVNELKKGSKVILKNGWNATIMDNAKGQTRMCLVEGFYTELGSVYSTDIAKVFVEGQLVLVEHSEAHLKSAKMRKAMGF